MQMTEKASIEFNGRRIEYTVVRSRRRKKTIEITLDPQQGVIVRTPARTPGKEIADLVSKRAGWILRKATDDILRPTPRRFIDGETLPYLGSELPIVTGTAVGRSISVSLQDACFHIAVPGDIPDCRRAEESRAALERWYRNEASRLLPEIVARWQGKVSRKRPARVLIRNQRRRWGSCSSDGSIRLNSTGASSWPNRPSSTTCSSPRTRPPRRNGPLAPLLEASRAHPPRLPNPPPAPQPSRPPPLMTF